MKQSKIEELYHSFTPESIKKLDAFIQCKAFNDSELIYKTHLFISETTLNQKTLDKKELHKKLYGKKTYSDGRVRFSLHKLEDIVHHFIITQRYNPNNFIYKNELIEYSKEKKLIKNWSYLIKESPENKISEKFQTEITEYNKNIFEYYAENEPHDVKKQIELYKNVLEAKDEEYVLNKLIMLCSARTYESVYKTKFDFLLEKEIIELSISPRFKNNILIQLYKHVFDLIENPADEILFNTFCSELFSAFEKLPFQDRLELLTHAQNFCIRKINAGNHIYFNALFNIYKKGVEHNTYTHYGEITDKNFNNIISASIKSKEISWANYFIENYHKHLTKESRTNGFHFNKARIDYYNKEYTSSLQHLLLIQFTDTFYGLNSKTLLLKTYYELEEREAFLSLAESLRIYILRKKAMSEAHKKSINSFLKYIKALFRLRKRETTKIEKLKQEITTAKVVLEKDWLLEKLSELDKK